MQLKVHGTTCTCRRAQESKSTLKWILYFVTFSLLFFIAILMKESRSSALFIKHEGPSVCKLEDYQINRKLKFARKIAEILKELDVTFALCHGSLYGALESSQLIPWDDVFDFCILDKDLFVHGLSAFYNKFSSHGIYVHYNFLIGEYFLNNGTEYARLIGLRNLFGSICKGGLKSLWSCVANYPYDSRFFSFYMEPPFKQAKLHDEVFPIPHDGFDLLKYLKPDSWWIDHTPENCKQKP